MGAHRSPEQVSSVLLEPDPLAPILNDSKTFCDFQVALTAIEPACDLHIGILGSGEIRSIDEKYAETHAKKSKQVVPNP